MTELQIREKLMKKYRINQNKIIRYMQILIIIPSFIILNQSNNLYSQTDNSLKYLGQKPPGLTAELFYGGDFVNTEKGKKRCFNVAFSPDGKEMFFSYYKGTEKKPHPEYEIKTFKLVNNTWTGPETASFSGKFSDCDINFSPDGKYIFFCSDRPQPRSASLDIYYCIKTDDGWSDPVYAGTNINTIEGEVYPSVSIKGNVFYRSSILGLYSDSDLYRAEWVNGNFVNVQNLGPDVNAPGGQSNAVIAPDEGYILFCRDLIYISFQTGNNIWTKAVKLGPEVNTKAGAGSPTLTPDGKYMFFKKRFEPARGIYWISTEIIDNLKKEIVK